ncbi:MAG TPA: hypothetical protein PK189_04785 [bacterium]|nr:hypothetical protein [bacterium]
MNNKIENDDFNIIELQKIIKETSASTQKSEYETILENLIKRFQNNKFLINFINKNFIYFYDEAKKANLPNSKIIEKFIEILKEKYWHYKLEESKKNKEHQVKRWLKANINKIINFYELKFFRDGVDTKEKFINELINSIYTPQLVNNILTIIKTENNIRKSLLQKYKEGFNKGHITIALYLTTNNIYDFSQKLNLGIDKRLLSYIQNLKYKILVDIFDVFEKQYIRLGYGNIRLDLNSFLNNYKKMILSNLPKIFKLQVPK